MELFGEPFLAPGWKVSKDGQPLQLVLYVNTDTQTAIVAAVDHRDNAVVKDEASPWGVQTVEVKDGLTVEATPVPVTTAPEFAMGLQQATLTRPEGQEALRKALYQLVGEHRFSRYRAPSDEWIGGEVPPHEQPVAFIFEPTLGGWQIGRDREYLQRTARHPENELVGFFEDRPYQTVQELLLGSTEDVRLFRLIRDGTAEEGHWRLPRFALLGAGLACELDRVTWTGAVTLTEAATLSFWLPGVQFGASLDWGWVSSAGPFPYAGWELKHQSWWFQASDSDQLLSGSSLGQQLQDALWRQVHLERTLAPEAQWRPRLQGRPSADMHYDGYRYRQRIGTVSWP